MTRKRIHKEGTGKQDGKVWCDNCESEQEYWHDWHPVDLEGVYSCDECQHLINLDESRNLGVAEPFRSIINGMFPQ